MATNIPVGPDTPITVKITLQGNNRKFKIPLRDLGANTLPDKLRFLLAIPSNQEVTFERFSDSAGAYITLDPENTHVYKSLYRAAKAKLKLRLRATLPGEMDKNAAPAEPTPNVSTTTLVGPSICQANNINSTSATVPRLSPAEAMQEINKRRLLAARASAARASMEWTLGNHTDGEGEGEAPVPRSFPARENFVAELANISRARELALRMREPPAVQQICPWSVYCNACDKLMANEHFHCSICDDGDYDLCESCVDAGVHCLGEGHWLVKRFVKNGKVINSTTERIGPKAKPKAEKEMPGAFTEEKKVEVVEEPTRTCNCCVKVFPENEFVTCTTCYDYDLCVPCHVGTKHGHHPGHAFKPATEDTSIGSLAHFLCAPGRNVRHHAICDGCDKTIYGVRHKCLNCPDWDYCSECVKSAKYIHPIHRFAPIYDPLPEPRTISVRHYGIYCDGPLCQGKDNQSYIDGVRYKCAVCHDTDFCANCEASPRNKHNRTHPLIKFKTPVRNVSVTTMGEDKYGAALATMGDQPPKRFSATETAPAAPAVNATTEVQTVVDVKPVEVTAPKPVKEKIEIKDLLAEPIQEKIKVQDLLATPIQEEVKPAEPAIVRSPTPVKVESPKPVPISELNAHFVRDTIPDGSKMVPNQRFIQVWTMTNPGPHAWPAGCSVRYVGGDNMLNVDHSHPSSATDIAEATESNVIGRPVEVGEEISFRVLMKAGKREGTHISYWRLKAADGTPFGHRLWCHIDVVKPPTPVFEHIPIPPAPPVASAVPHMSPEAHAKQIEEYVKAQATNNIALQDYQMQLMLLEQARIRRVIQRNAEAEQESRDERRASVALSQKIVEPQERVTVMAPPAKTEADTASADEKSEQPVEEKPAEVAEQNEAPPEAAAANPEGSTMVFPQLEKESPVSSTHHDAAEAPKVESSVAPTSPSTAAHEETGLFEDAEDVDIVESSSSVDGFLTDDEYDILAASDEDLA